jgi:hypothetical protein
LPAAVELRTLAKSLTVFFKKWTYIWIDISNVWIVSMSVGGLKTMLGVDRLFE